MICCHPQEADICVYFSVFDMSFLILLHYSANVSLAHSSGVAKRITLSSEKLPSYFTREHDNKTPSIILQCCIFLNIYGDSIVPMYLDYNH